MSIAVAGVSPMSSPPTVSLLDELPELRAPSEPDLVMSVEAAFSDDVAIDRCWPSAGTLVVSAILGARTAQLWQRLLQERVRCERAVDWVRSRKLVVWVRSRTWCQFGRLQRGMLGPSKQNVQMHTGGTSHHTSTVI